MRIYSSLGPASDILQEAERSGLKVNLGIWLRSEQDEAGAEANRKEIGAAIGLMSNPAVDTVTVGNEVLLRGDLNEDALRQAIRQVRTARDAANLSVKITTADVDDQWLRHPHLAEDVDFVTVHLYPFWAGVPVADAIAKLDESYIRVTNAFPDKQVMIGETGWPSDGSSVSGTSSSARSSSPPGEASPASAPAIAVGSPVSQASYLRDFLAWARGRKLSNYYYFEAFDEDWKVAEEGDAGGHWGLYDSDGNFKAELRDLIPAASYSTVQSRRVRNVFVSALSSGLALDIDTSGKSREWLTAESGLLRLAYPAGQTWGAMFITAGKLDAHGKRPSIDMSKYKSLEMELRLADANAKSGCVYVAVKETEQPNDGSEVKVEQCLSGPKWQTMTVPLDAFVGANLARLYVLTEIVFADSVGPIEIRNIRYSPIQVSMANLAIRNIYSGGLSEGFSINVDTSAQKREWVAEGNGVITLSYPGRQEWGAMFITVGKPVPYGQRSGVDLSNFNTVMVDVRLTNANAVAGCIELGVKDRTQPDNGEETKVAECVESVEWKTHSVPLQRFGRANLKQLYVVLEVVYGSRVVGPIQLRNIRYAYNP